MNDRLRAKLKTLPSSPGVYFHKSASGEIIYVGKAAVLKNRVRQYFQSKKDMDAKTLALVHEITDTDWIETDSELDALFLEAEMVKRYMPRYNIDLRDDKSATYVRIDIKSDLPFVGFTRQPIDDGAEYIGPFYSGGAVKNALRYLRKIFPYFTKKSELKSALLLQLGLVPNVETAAQKSAYKKSLRQLISYIKGNRVKVQNEIEKEMKAAAKNHNFELAATKRNQLRDLNELRRQIVFSREEFLDISKDRALIGLRDLLNLEKVPRRIEAYDISHINGTNNVASMVVATNGVADKRQYRKFKISRDRNDDMAAMREVITRRLKHLKDWGRPDLVIIDGGIGQLNAVADLLNSENIPFLGRNKSGDHSRNARVVIAVLNSSHASLPGLTGQSSNKRLDLPDKPANDADGWIPDQVRNDSASYQTIELGTDDHIAKLIARLDEEAHRFAVSYHQTLRGKKQTENALEQISGIGPMTRKKLIKKFGSVAGMKLASETEIAEIVGQSKAKIIKQNMVQ
ncbi:UvrB/UvrC motif-containing protein [Candidatus Saccharibacteria bacterium]|nr:UvrB/UvrC motif-containing protein [Candidatus Saccharibacteria bacterium]